MKYSLLLCLALSGCGVGSDTTPTDRTMSVRLDANTVLPSPFVVGPSGTIPTGTVPIVTFVTTPVVGIPAVITPPVVSTVVTAHPINWCTDGFTVGPCTTLPLRCQPNEFTVGPCP